MTRSAARKPSSRKPVRKRRFIAAVRFTDGHTQCFSVDDAKDYSDARRMVLDALEEVAAVVISDYGYAY